MKWTRVLAGTSWCDGRCSGIGRSTPLPLSASIRRRGCAGSVTSASRTSTSIRRSSATSATSRGGKRTRSEKSFWPVVGATGCRSNVPLRLPASTKAHSAAGKVGNGAPSVDHCRSLINSYAVKTLAEDPRLRSRSDRNFRNTGVGQKLVEISDFSTVTSLLAEAEDCSLLGSR